MSKKAAAAKAEAPEAATTEASTPEPTAASTTTPAKDTFKIGRVSYEVLERFPEGVLHLRYTYPEQHRDGTHEVREFHYDPEAKRKVSQDKSGKFAFAKGLIPGTRLGKRRDAAPEKKETTAPPVRKTQAAPTPPPANVVKLSNKAHNLLEEYLMLSGGGDRDDAVSRLIVHSLEKDIERLRAGHEFMKKIPADLLPSLADLSVDELRKLLAR